MLSRTPSVLEMLLQGLPRAWETANEGQGTFSPREVLGHLIQGEREDWIPRAQMIVEHGESRSFEPFERFAHRKWFDAFTTAELLAELRRLREANLERLAGWNHLAQISRVMAKHYGADVGPWRAYLPILGR